MAKLYFRYGVMGSSKTANALMVRYNYEERGQEALLVKPELDQRDGAKFVASRMGLSHTCIYFSELQAMPEEKVRGYACVIVDEAQFLSRDEVQYLVGVVDDPKISSFLSYIGQDLYTELADLTYEGLCAHIDAACARIGDTEFLSGGVDRLRKVERRNSETAAELLGK